MAPVQYQKGKQWLTSHSIDTGQAEPVAQHPYRVNPIKRIELQQQIQALLDANQIEPSESSWASPVLLVPKKDGGWLLCVDYRRLNNATRKVSYPLPRTDDCYDYLLDAAIFSKLDAAAGYWQIPMETEI